MNRDVVFPMSRFMLNILDKGVLSGIVTEDLDNAAVVLTQHINREWPSTNIKYYERIRDRVERELAERALLQEGEKQ